MFDEKQKLAEAKKRLAVIRLAVKLGDEELLLKLGASEETIQSVRRIARCRSGNWAASPASYLLGDEASSTAIKS